MTRNRITGLGALLVALAFALPGDARAEDAGPPADAEHAMDCAIRYARNAMADVRFLERQMALRDHFGLDHEEIALMAMLGDVSDVIPVEWIVEELAECDRSFGFAPITQVIDSRPAIPRITDFDCAVAYRLLAALRQDQAAEAMERTRHALGHHHAANPGVDPNSLGPQVNALATARGQQMQQGQATVEALSNDIAACEARYGFAAARGQ